MWNEIVAPSFGLELENYATGNAISGGQGEAAGSWTVLPPYANLTSSRQVFVPSTLDQVSYISCATSLSLQKHIISAQGLIQPRSHRKQKSSRVTAVDAHRSCHLQAQAFLSLHHGIANSANTYVIFIGGNDYLNNINGTNNATVAGVVQAINQTMLNLYTAGARQ